MKKNIFVGILICTTSSLFAQNFNFLSRYTDITKFEVIDSAYIKIDYRLTYNKDAAKSDKTSSDLQVLLIGSNISKYYSQYRLDYNLFTSTWLKTHDAYPSIKENGAWSYEVFKNYPSEKETVTDIASMLGGNYIYEENLPAFNWKIENETQTVFNYTCWKATVFFRGRDFVAWFAPEIPISNGPWKFGGLPGLILKLYDTRNQFVYECIGLENLKRKEPIMFYEIDYSKLTRQELYKLYQRFHYDFVVYLKNTYGTEVVFSNSKENATHSPYKIPYNPIELE